MKNFKSTILLALSIVGIFISSCQKDNNLPSTAHGEGTVSIKLNGIASGSAKGKAAKATAALGHQASSPAVQQQNINIGGYNLSATLREVGTLQAPKALRASAKAAAQLGENPGDIEAFTGDYHINVFPQGEISEEQLIHSFELSQNDDNEAASFNLAAGDYTFVVTAYGNPNGAGADRDPLSVSEDVHIAADAENVIALTLFHELTKVTVQFDARVAGIIEDIAGARINPDEDYGFNEKTAALAFNGLRNEAGKSFSFVKEEQANDYIWTSEPVMIATPGTNNGTIYLDGVKINGKIASTLKGGWNLQPGVQYELEIGIPVPENAILIPGGEKLDFFPANANLVGTTPVQLESGQHPKGSVYDGNGSQGYCAGALGDGWVMPDSTQYKELIALGTVRGSYEGQTGWFFGTNDLSAAEANPNSYMFLPDNDFVRSTSGKNSVHIPATGVAGVYWADEDTQGTAKDALILPSDPNATPSIIKIHQNNEIGIRCVRAK